MPNLVFTSLWTDGLFLGTIAGCDKTPVRSEHNERTTLILTVISRLQTVQPHASEFGFFLDFPRFCEDAIRPLPAGHHMRPCPALLSAVYLWGVHISQLGPFLSREQNFLSQALQDSASNLSSNHPRKIIHGIQAEILLSILFSSRQVSRGKIPLYCRGLYGVE